MIERSLAHSTRTTFADERLLEEIAELTGMEYRVLCRVFAGEEKNLTLDVVKTAVAKNPQGTPEDRQVMYYGGPKRTILESTAPAAGTATSLSTSTTTSSGASGGSDATPAP